MRWMHYQLALSVRRSAMLPQCSGVGALIPCVAITLQTALLLAATLHPILCRTNITHPPPLFSNHVR